MNHSALFAGHGQAFCLLVEAEGQEAAHAGIGSLGHAGLERVVDLVRRNRHDRRAGRLPHLREGRARGAELQPLDVIGLEDAAALGHHAAAEPGVRQNDRTGLLDVRVDVLHELRVVEPLGALVAAHQSGHQGRAERAHLAARVVEREQGDVELAVDQRIPLLLRLEQRGAGIDLDVEIDVRGLGVAGDHLHHVVAHVALAAGKLMRGPHDDGRRDDGARNQHGDPRGKHADFLELTHRFLLQVVDRIRSGSAFCRNVFVSAKVPAILNLPRPASTQSVALAISARAVSFNPEADPRCRRRDPYRAILEFRNLAERIERRRWSADSPPLRSSRTE